MYNLKILIPSSISSNIEDICNLAEENFGIIDSADIDRLKLSDKFILDKIKNLECFSLLNDRKFNHNLASCKNLRYCYLCGFINKISQIKFSSNKQNFYCSNCFANVYNLDGSNLVHYMNMNLTVCGTESQNCANILIHVTCPVCKLIGSIEYLFEKLENNNIEIGYNDDLVFLKVNFNIMKIILSESKEEDIKNKLKKILCIILKRNDFCLHFSQYIDTEEPNILNFLLVSHQDSYCIFN